MPAKQRRGAKTRENKIKRTSGLTCSLQLEHVITDPLVQEVRNEQAVKIYAWPQELSMNKKQ
jgi:hypothetical protein